MTLWNVRAARSLKDYLDVHILANITQKPETQVFERN